MNPYCAICHAPIATRSDCEAKALEVAVRQAESRILQRLRNEAENWVRRHDKNRVLTRFRTAKSEIKDERFSALHDLKPILDDASGYASYAANMTFKRKINRLWSEAFQTYPSSMDQLYSLVNYNLPSDDDPAVRAPPLGDHTKQRDYYDSDRPYQAYPSSHPSSMSSKYCSFVSTGNAGCRRNSANQDPQ